MKRSDTNVCPDSSAPGRAIANSRVLTQTTRCKSFPQYAEILPTSEDLISLYNSITSIKERRTASLEFHSVNNKPEIRR